MSHSNLLELISSVADMDMIILWYVSASDICKESSLYTIRDTGGRCKESTLLNQVRLVEWEASPFKCLPGPNLRYPVKQLGGSE